jgi:hypothetical protein
VRTDVSEERIASIIRVKRISELGKTSGNVLTRATRRPFPEDSIHQNYSYFNLHNAGMNLKKPATVENSKFHKNSCEFKITCCVRQQHHSWNDTLCI